MVAGGDCTRSLRGPPEVRCAPTGQVHSAGSGGRSVYPGRRSIRSRNVERRTEPSGQPPAAAPRDKERPPAQKNK